MDSALGPHASPTRRVTGRRSQRRSLGTRRLPSDTKAGRQTDCTLRQSGLRRRPSATATSASDQPDTLGQFELRYVKNIRRS
ncbi:hypothetical protein DTO280E4_4876 [Paecilomyces variotii]|nr:hypothetical protein DTO280E4_4876 [Paecilomyces variotii]